MSKENKDMFKTLLRWYRRWLRRGHAGMLTHMKHDCFNGNERFKWEIYRRTRKNVLAELKRLKNAKN